MKLIVLRAGDVTPSVAARRGEYFSWIRREAEEVWNGDWGEHDIRLDSPLPDPSSADGFIITGSSSNVTERAAWMLRAEEFVRSIVRAKVPLFGICFGHQLIAEALGGNVAKNPRGREIGTVDVRVKVGAENDPIVAGLPRTFKANATHMESVLRLPPDAVLLAETSLEPNAIYAVGESTKCVQFHPEIDGDAMRGYVDARAPLVLAEGLDAEAIRDAAVDTPHGAATLRNFVRFVVRRDRS